MENITNRFKKIIVEQLDVNQEIIRPNAHFGNELEANSLDFVLLVMAVEEEFGIKIPEADVENFQTVGEAIDYLEKRLA